MINMPIPFMPPILPSLPSLPLIADVAPVAVGGSDFDQMLQSAAQPASPVVQPPQGSAQLAFLGGTANARALVAAMRSPDAELAITVDAQTVTQPGEMVEATDSARAAEQLSGAQEATNAELPLAQLAGGNEAVRVSTAPAAVQISAAATEQARPPVKAPIVEAKTASARKQASSPTPELGSSQQAVPKSILLAVAPLQPNADPVEKSTPMIVDPIAAAGAVVVEKSATASTPVGETMPLAPTAADVGRPASIAQAVPVDAGLAIANRQLDLSLGEQWLDQLANDIVAARSEESTLSFKLLPPRLGELDISLQRADEGMTLAFETSNDESAQIIMAAQPKLVEELRAQGLRVADAQVNGGASQGGRQEARHGQQQQNAHHAETRQQSAPATAPKNRHDERYA